MSKSQPKNLNYSWKQSDRQEHFALILAAGFSTRMGTCKTTLPWRNNQTLLSYQATQFLQAGITPIIVLGLHNAERKYDCPEGSLVVTNKQCSFTEGGIIRDRGKTSSILTGLQSLPSSFLTITISAVDQPRPAYIYQTLLDNYYQKKALIVAPCYQGKSGHPLLFSARLLSDLKNIDESTFGLRKIVHKFYSKITKVAFSTSEIMVDINQQNSYHLELQRISLTHDYD